MARSDLISYWLDTAERDHRTIGKGMAAQPTHQVMLDIAERYADALRKEFNLLGLYVYGSHVKGTPREDSDIDIAVVADAFSGDTVEDTWRLMKLRRAVDMRIEPHPFLPSEFTEGNPMALEVMRTGIRIV